MVLPKALPVLGVLSQVICRVGQPMRPGTSEADGGRTICCVGQPTGCGAGGAAGGVVCGIGSVEAHTSTAAAHTTTQMQVTKLATKAHLLPNSALSDRTGALPMPASC